MARALEVINPPKEMGHLLEVPTACMWANMNGAELTHAGVNTTNK